MLYIYIYIYIYILYIYIYMYIYIYFYVQVALVLINENIFNEFQVTVYRKKSLGPFIFDYEKSHTKPWFNKHCFKEFPQYMEQKYRFPL